jgi:hypothetical protein
MSQTSNLPPPTTSGVDFYSTPAVMTDLAGCPTDLFEGMPADPRALCHMVQGLLVHEFWAPAYGLKLGGQRTDEVRTRRAAAMVATILRLDPAPLAQARPPERRTVGNCRHFSTLSVALLQRAGIPARARCGFAGYFEPDKMVDHWVTEYWSAKQMRWVRADAQLDDLQRQTIKPSFDPDDLGDGPFVPAGEAWQRCRAGEDDPARYGILDMWGLWFIHSNVIRDLAALNKIEMLPWDVWGPMAIGQDPDPAEAELIDHAASVLAAGDPADVRHLYDSLEHLQVPPEVVDGRFGGTYRIGT